MLHTGGGAGLTVSAQKGFSPLRTNGPANPSSIEQITVDYGIRPFPPAVEVVQEYQGVVVPPYIPTAKELALGNNELWYNKAGDERSGTCEL